MSNYEVANEKISRHQVFEHVEHPVGHQFCIGDDRQPQKYNGELTTLVAPLSAIKSCFYGDYMYKLVANW